MSYRSALILGGVGAALFIGSFQAGCGSSGGTGTAGSTGSAATTGNAGTGGGPGTGGSSNAGTTGSGGSSACRNDFLEVTADVTTDMTWPCNSYVLKQKVHIDGGSASNIVTLAIAAGSTIYGDGSPASPAALISTRNGRLVAVGTAAAPITFTSFAPVGQRTPGDTFAGVVMLGRASINRGSCVNGNGACAPPGYFQDHIEGIPADDPKGQFGGTDDTWNCGDLRYLRIQFAGYTIGEGNELNGLTLGGCGSQTRISYIHVHRAFDDGIECFGGTANMDHIILTGSTDDGLDWDEGYSGKIQFLIVQRAYGVGDKGFEADNYQMTQTATPRSNPEIWNATLIGDTGNGTIGMHLRRGTWYKLRNLIVYNWGRGGVDVDAEFDPAGGAYMPAADWPTHISIEDSLFFGGPISPIEPTDPATSTNMANNDYSFDESAAITDPARMNSTTADPMFPSTITAPIINNPSYIPGNAAAVTGKATPPAGFDQTATYAGAVDPSTTAGSAWYDGWTEFPQN